MELRTLRRYSLRQLQLPEEYNQKLLRVKQIIKLITGSKPSSETTVMCLIDEFLNQHGEVACECIDVVDMSASGNPIELRTVSMKVGSHD